MKQKYEEFRKECYEKYQLNWMLSHGYSLQDLIDIREREKDEAELLEQYMDLYDDWQVDLSEWRLAHNYHRLTDTRAQKFAREFKKK